MDLDLWVSEQAPDHPRHTAAHGAHPPGLRHEATCVPWTHVCRGQVLTQLAGFTGLRPCWLSGDRVQAQQQQQQQQLQVQGRAQVQQQQLQVQGSVQVQRQ